jgi:hypothetical protein
MLYRIPDHPAALRSPETFLIMRALEVWILISAAEVVHGIARITFLQPLVGDFTARQIAVFTGSLLVIAIAIFFRRWIGAVGVHDCIIVGSTWVLLTVAFEVFLGIVILGLTWERILSDYDIVHGGLMPIGLILMFLAPLIAQRVTTRP